MKTCTKCLTAKPYECFSKKGLYNGRQRYRSDCKDCYAAYNQGHYAKWYSENAERKRAYHREWVSQNREKCAENNNKRRALLASADHAPYSRTEILDRWSERCCYCDAPAEHLDHVRPISRGGADAEPNLVPACAACNCGKGAKTLAEWAETF